MFDDEVDGARDDAGARDHERAAVADDGEDARGGERGERDARRC